MIPRRKILTETIIPNDCISFSEQLITSEPRDIEQFMDRAVSDGCEGLILKSTGSNSTYQAGARGWVWVKYKRAYKSEITSKKAKSPKHAKHRGRQSMIFLT